MTTPQTNEQWAEHYRCSVRTVAQMKSEGIDLCDPAAVAFRLVNVHTPSLPMLERVGQLLNELP